MSQKSKLLSGGSWALSKIFGVQLINIGAIAILSRQLSPADFGLVALANVALRFFGVLSSQGINQFAIYDNSPNHQEKLNAAFWLNLIVSIGSVLIGIAAIPLISNFYSEPLLATILLVLLLRFPLDVTSKLFDSILHKNLDFKAIEIRDFALQLSTALLGVIMALNGYGVWSLIVPSLIAAPIRLFLACQIVKWRPKTKLYIEHWREIFKYSSTIIGSSFTNFTITQGDTLLVGRLLGTTKLGFYNLSWGASNLVSKTLVTLTNKLAFPAFSAQKKDLGRIYNMLSKILFTIASISFPILMWMLVVPDYIILTLYGEQWIDSIIPFQILLIYAIRYSVGAPIGSVFKAMGRPDLNLKLGLVTIPFYLIGIWLGSEYGIIGVAIGVTITRTVFGFISFWLVGKVLTKQTTQVLSPLKMPFLVSVTSCAFVCLIDRLWFRPNYDSLPFVGLIFSFILMSVSYLILSKYFFKEIGVWLGDLLQDLSKGRIRAVWFR